MDFCTYFDHRYFARALAMHASLEKHCPGARLWVLCLSEPCHSALVKLELPNVFPIRLEEFEEGNLELVEAKANRSLIEYYFTLTPCLMDWLLAQNPGIEAITYLDSDLFFYSSVAPILEAFRGHSTLIIGHRFAPAARPHEIYGKYNVGWVSFRRDADGLAALCWWRDRCLEWCYDYLDGDRFADQKYLDRFPELFSGVLIYDHPGANLAPWNLDNHRLLETASGILVDGKELIFFHFHDFKLAFPFVWRTYHWLQNAPRQAFVRRKLYRPYIEALRKGNATAQHLGLDVPPALHRRVDRKSFLRDLVTMVVRGEYVVDLARQR